jgi:hypothetical protein
MINMTQQEAREFIRRVMGPPRRELEGAERDQVILMLAMLGKPTRTSNNQRSYSEEYEHAGRYWCVTTWPDGQYIVEEIEHETDT